MNDRHFPESKVIVVDVDETLVYHVPMGETGDKVVVLDNATIGVRVNKKLVDTIQRWDAQGALVIVWSKMGADWALAVVKMLGLVGSVHTMEKPSCYVDDKKCTHWMGAWIKPEEKV